MKGRLWLVLGVAAGIAIGVGRLPYLTGSATSLAETAERLIGSGGLTLVDSAAKHGASRRVVEALQAVLGVLVPGVTALLLVVAARSSLHLRAVIALLLVALGAAAFVYLPRGTATGVLLLTLVAAGIAVVGTGPLLSLPLTALAALIATVYLPKLLSARNKLPQAPVNALHEAIYSTPGSPLWLRVAVLALSALPFAFAARLVVR